MILQAAEAVGRLAQRISGFFETAGLFIEQGQVREGEGQIGLESGGSIGRSGPFPGGAFQTRATGSGVSAES